MGYFLSGLREALKGRIKTHAPRTILRAMDLAQGVEEELDGAPMGHQYPKYLMGLRLEGRESNFSGWASRAQVSDSEKYNLKPYVSGASRNITDNPYVLRATRNIMDNSNRRTIGPNSPMNARP